MLNLVPCASSFQVGSAIGKAQAPPKPMTRKEMYRYVVTLSVKHVDALEELILHVNSNGSGCLLLDIEERDEYKRAKE